MAAKFREATAWYSGVDEDLSLSYQGIVSSVEGGEPESALGDGAGLTVRANLPSTVKILFPNGIS